MRLFSQTATDQKLNSPFHPGTQPQRRSSCTQPADKIKQTDRALNKMDKNQSNEWNLAQCNGVKVVFLLHKCT